MFQPDKITKEHVLRAVQRIKEDKITLHSSRIYDVEIEGEWYAPKEVMRFAHEEMNGEHIWENSGGDPTNRFLQEMGFRIRQKNKTEDPVADLILSYKKRLREDGLNDEQYKWVLAKKFHHRPDTSKEDFALEYKSIDYSNLLYFNSKTVGIHIATERPDEFRQEFILLFDENTALSTRVKRFSEETLKIYRQLWDKKEHSHHQDERAISTYLAYYDANLYPFYKDSFYRKFCNLLNIKSKPSGEKYLHYVELLDDFIEEYINPDNELLDLVATHLPKEAHEDASHYLLAQDILYRMLDHGQESEIENNSMKYWLYAPGRNAEFWNEFYELGVMGLGWDKLGDLTQYENKEAIVRRLQELEKTSGSKKNDASANFDFKEKISIGDIIIVKGGINTLLGYGIVQSDYYFDDLRERYQKCRKVKWKLKGEWHTHHSLPVKTLTDITKYDTIEPAYDKYYEYLMAVINDEYEIPELENKDNKESKDFSLNTILYGPPGTGKTYHTIDLAVKIAAPASYENNNHFKNKQTFDELLSQGQIVFTTFHQSMCYEDFIEGIKPLKPEKEDSFLKYDIEDGVFKKICAAAITPNQLDFNSAYKNLQEKLSSEEIIELKTPTGRPFSISINSNGNLNLHTGTARKIQGTLTKENIQKQLVGENVFEYWQGYFNGVIKYLKSEFNYNPESVISGQKFVLIIDEINRGNVAEIFGELITLVEEDKRQGNPESTKVTLPYSKATFTVPSNLYIIGTMNTADRSVEALDTALRRRFSFLEMMPRYDLPGLEIQIEGQSLGELLELINCRIEKLLDRDHQIGHSYFLNITSLEQLQIVFKDKVLPLLQEYFYGNYEKIGMVLGEGFISANGKDTVGFAKFGVDDPDIFEKRIYDIRNEPFESVEAFREALALLIN